MAKYLKTCVSVLASLAKRGSKNNCRGSHPLFTPSCSGIFYSPTTITRVISYLQLIIRVSYPNTCHIDWKHPAENVMNNANMLVEDEMRNIFIRNAVRSHSGMLLLPPENVCLSNCFLYFIVAAQFIAFSHASLRAFLASQSLTRLQPGETLSWLTTQQNGLIKLKHMLVLVVKVLPNPLSSIRLCLVC